MSGLLRCGRDIMNTGHTLTDEQLRVLNLMRTDLGKPPLTREQCDAKWKPIRWPERRDTLAALNEYVDNGYALAGWLREELS